MTFQTSFTRGETFSLALEATDGDVSGATCEADIKAAVNGQPPADIVPPLEVFAVSPVAEVTPGGGAGWILTLTPAQTVDIGPGIYVVDARVTLANGFVEQTDVVRVTVKERVTA